MPLQNKFSVATLCCAAALIAASSHAASAADFTYNEKTNADLAKKLALDLLDPANFNKMSSAGGALFTPAYEKLWTPELLASDPNLAVIKAQVSVKEPFLGSSWPALPSAPIDAIRAQGVVEQMVGNVISGRMSPEDGVKDAHNKIVQIFEEGGIMQP